MANGPELRISNVLGTPIFQWVINQLGTRAENNSSDKRDDSNLIYLANKTGWFRIVSSVKMPEYPQAIYDVSFDDPNFMMNRSIGIRSKTYKYFKDKYPNRVVTAKNNTIYKTYLLVNNLDALLEILIYIYIYK